MPIISFAKDLYLYTGSTFDGSIVIKDVHGEPFLISEGDELTFFIKKADKMEFFFKKKLILLAKKFLNC